MLNMLNMSDFKGEDDRDNEKASVSLYELCKVKSKTDKFDYRSKSKSNFILFINYKLFFHKDI